MLTRTTCYLLATAVYVAMGPESGSDPRFASLDHRARGVLMALVSLAPPPIAATVTRLRRMLLEARLVRQWGRWRLARVAAALVPAWWLPDIEARKALRV